MVSQTYTISTVKNAVPPKVKMSQYDSASRTITFSVVDGSGSAVSLTGKTVTVEGTRIDGHAFAASCTVSGSTVTFTETVDMTNAAGDHPAELVIRENGQRLGTMNFIISVEPAAMDEDAEITEEDKSLFEQLYGVGDAALSAAETLYQHILDNASAPIIYNTASGAVASFTDGADDYPIKGLTVAVEPVQSGSGDPSPSNVRPISGWSEVKVTRTGKNLLRIDEDTLAKPSWYQGTWAGTTTPAEGTITVTRSSASGGFGGVVIPTGLKAGTYTLSGKCPSTINTKTAHRGIYDGSNYEQLSFGSISESSTSFNFTFTLAEDAVEFYIKLSGSNDDAPITFSDLQIELGSTATDYEPYSGNTYTISLGDTVYGGTLDVVKGKMVVDRAMIDLGTLTWRRRSSNRFSTTIPFYYNLTKDISAYMSNTFTVIYVAGYAAVSTNIGILKRDGDASSNTVYLGMIDYDVDSLEDLSTWFTNNPTYLVYPLADPVEISLTPTQINTLLGANNVYSDAGDVSVEYPADTKQFILNAIASALA